MNEGLFETQAIMVRENVLRLVEIPLYLNTVLPADLPLQSRLRVQLQDIDWIQLEVGVRVLGRVEGAEDSVEMLMDELDEDLGEAVGNGTPDALAEVSADEVNEVDGAAERTESPSEQPETIDK